MKGTVVTTIGLLFCLGVPLAQAQGYWILPDGAGPYFRAGIGPTFYQNGTLRSFSGGDAPNGPSNQTVSYDTGFDFDAALGFAFCRYFGADFESGYVWGRINSVTGYSSNGSTLSNIPLLVNGTFSLPIPHTNIVPYLGAGVGGAVSTFDAHSFGAATTDTLYGSQSDTVFAYQAFAGVRFMLTGNFSLGLGYKYFATGNSTFDYPPGPDVDVSFKGVRTHSVMFTLQYNF